MPKTAVFNIRTNPETKKAVEELYSHFGITVSDAVNIFFNKSLMENGIPFDVTVKKTNAETLAAIAEVKDMKRNPHLYKSFDSVEALFEDLNSEDEI